MKLSFEGKTFEDVAKQMINLLEGLNWGFARHSGAPKTTDPVAQGPGPEAIATAPDPIGTTVDNPADNPTDNPAETPVEKPFAKKMREAKEAKKTAPKEPKPPKAKAAKAAPVEKLAPPPADVDPAEMVRIRQQTLEELQAAYANGHQQEVFELLSRFGNGAKSFRELPPEAYGPIREAIDNGALT